MRVVTMLVVCMLSANFGVLLQLIEELQLCHRDHPVAKFWGHCNDQKIALDACFRQEKKLNR